MTPRNEPMGMGIVERTRKNLDFIAEARRAGADVHEVTHLLNSLLGLVVLPWERVDRNILSAKVQDLKGQDWLSISKVFDPVIYTDIDPPWESGDFQ